MNSRILMKQDTLYLITTKVIQVYICESSVKTEGESWKVSGEQASFQNESVSSHSTLDMYRTKHIVRHIDTEICK